MRKSFSDAVTELGEQIGLDTVNVSAHETRVQRWINDIRESIEELPYDFKSLQYVGQLRTYVHATAGTVAVSADSKEVTGSSTTWTSEISKPYNQYWITIASGHSYRVQHVVDDTHL